MMNQFNKNKSSLIIFTALLLYAVLLIANIAKFDLNIMSIRKLISGKELRKFVIFECDDKYDCGGLADRFKGTLNAYVWSLFTKRHLIVNITKPCNFNNLMVSSKIDWDLNLDDLVREGYLRPNYTTALIDKMDESVYRDGLVNMDIINYENESDIIIIKTNLEWISAFAKNRYLNSSIKELGFKDIDFHISTTFHKWFNDIFLLNATVQEKFDVYLKKLKPTVSTKSICIQVRIGGTRPNVESDRDITPRNFSTFYWEFVKEKFIKENNDNYRVFVTSDTQSVEEEAQEVFGKEKTVVIDGISTHIDKETGYKDDCTRFKKVVMDFYMLGYCDMALVSDSGFGIFGILRNRIPDENYYVLTALPSDMQNHEFFTINDFIYANAHRY